MAHTVNILMDVMCIKSTLFAIYNDEILKEGPQRKRLNSVTIIFWLLVFSIVSFIFRQSQSYTCCSSSCSNLNCLLLSCIFFNIYFLNLTHFSTHFSLYSRAWLEILLHPLTADQSVICKHHNPMRFLSNHIFNYRSIDSKIQVHGLSLTHVKRGHTDKPASLSSTTPKYALSLSNIFFCQQEEFTSCRTSENKLRIRAVPLKEVNFIKKKKSLTFNFCLFTFLGHCESNWKKGTTSVRIKKNSNSYQAWRAKSKNLVVLPLMTFKTTVHTARPYSFAAKHLYVSASSGVTLENWRKGRIALAPRVLSL